MSASGGFDDGGSVPSFGVSSSLDSVQQRLRSLHTQSSLSWREIASLPQYEGIPPGTLCAIAKGRDPKNPEYRRKLGLPRICPNCGAEISW